MVDGRHFEKIEKWQYLHDRWTNFDQIWHGDIPQSSRPLQLKFCPLKIQHGGELRSGKSISQKHLHQFQQNFSVLMHISPGPVHS